MTDPASEDGEVIRAITWLTHLSDYQLASVAYSVNLYSKNHGYFIATFLSSLGSFCVTQLL